MEPVSNLSNDSLRLLKLISLYTGLVNGREKWIKSYALCVLIIYGIEKGVFETYDYAPVITLWHGYMRAVNMSMEAEADLNHLRKMGLIKKLRLATSKYRFVTAYMVSDKGEKLLKEIPETVVKKVTVTFTEDGEPADILIDESGETYLEFPSGRKIKVPILEIEDVPYRSSPIFY